MPAAGSKPATHLPTGSESEPNNKSAGLARAASLGSAGPQSHCEPYREIILAKVQEDLSAKRIWQDLGESGATVGYDSVRRFIQRLGRVRSLPFRRMECGPGEEAQVDFGSGAPVIRPDGKRRRTHVFRIVLSHSRKAYSEATFTQTTEDFFRCLENAFAHFGGVPQTLVIDNLKAAVAHPDWFDPELTPKVQAFCRHYGTVILPTKPYMPRHKGKVESGVKYVKNNGLKAKKFTSLEEENRCLADWERTVADKQEPLPFLEEHPIIRPLADYSAIVAQAIHRQADRPSLGEGFKRHGWTEAAGASGHEKSLAARAAPGPVQANAADLLPPRSSYPSPGCTSAEPGSVSPDSSTIVPPSSSHQEKSDE